MSNDARNARTTAAILDAAAHALSEHGRSANMTDVADAAGISRATLYRYYPDREALLEALSAQALADAGSRLADAGLERAPVEEAIERIVRALTAVGDRYAVLVREQVEGDPDEIERLVAAPMRACSRAASRADSSGKISPPRCCSSSSAAPSSPPPSSSSAANSASRKQAQPPPPSSSTAPARADARIPIARA